MTINDSFDLHLDITGADEVEIRIDRTGKVIWVNTTYGCKLRICQIEHLTIVDDRPTIDQRKTNI